MSVIVALKYKDGVILGADKQATLRFSKSHSATKIMSSVYSYTAFGGAGAGRDLDILQCNIDDIMDYKDILDNVSLDKKYMVNKVVVKFFNLLLKYNRAYKTENIVELESEYIVVSTDSIFHIDNSGYVVEYDDYVAIGSGAESVMGYFATLKEQNLTREQACDYVKIAIKESCKENIFIDDNVELIDITRNKRRIKDE